MYLALHPELDDIHRPAADRAAALFAIPLVMADDPTIATRWVFFAVFALCPFVACLVAIAFERR